MEFAGDQPYADIQQWNEDAEKFNDPSLPELTDKHVSAQRCNNYIRCDNAHSEPVFYLQCAHSVRALRWQAHVPPRYRLVRRLSSSEFSPLVDSARLRRAQVPNGRRVGHHLRAHCASNTLPYRSSDNPPNSRSQNHLEETKRDLALITDRKIPDWVDALIYGTVLIFWSFTAVQVRRRQSTHTLISSQY